MICKIKIFWERVINQSIRNSNLSEETKIIYVYRYLSLIITSIVYLAGRPYSIIHLKIGVVISLFISSIIINNLYIKFKDNKGFIKKLVLIETIGITLLLIPTEGLKSPFIWYALNPTLIAACYLPAYFCWMNLIFYLNFGLAMSYIGFNPNNSNLQQLILDNSSLGLVFILITLAVQLLASLARKLNMLNESLIISNKQKQESLEHIMSLYQVIEALNNHSTKEKLFETIAKYTTKLTNSKLSFYWLPNQGNDDILNFNVSLSELENSSVLSQLRDLKINQTSGLQLISISDKWFYAIPILSPTRFYGIVGIHKEDFINYEIEEQSFQLLEFLAAFSAVTLDRFNIEDIEDQLVVMEEQNRIANEIHDSVSQRLFSISYAIHGIIGRFKDLTNNEIEDLLYEIKDSSNLAMQELRKSIYKLSSKKKGEKTLQISLKAFLDSLSALHQITIDFITNGDESVLSLSLKKGITRIIREACSNAVRHGKCNQINLELDISREFLSLSICDDGQGFIIVEDEDNEHNGIGLSNMKNIISSFNGSIKIQSNVGEGSYIDIMIPIEGASHIHKEGVAI